MIATCRNGSCLLLVALLAPMSVSADKGRSGNHTVVEKLPSDTQPGEIPGLPYRLTRPVFELKEILATPATRQTTYKIGLSYEPDPHQRYAVNMASGKSTEADLKLAYGPHGNLTQINSAVRDQLVPTVTAIGEFLISAASLATTAGAASAPAAFAGTGALQMANLLETSRLSFGERRFGFSEEIAHLEAMRGSEPQSQISCLPCLDGTERSAEGKCEDERPKDAVRRLIWRVALEGKVFRYDDESLQQSQEALASAQLAAAHSIKSSSLSGFYRAPLKDRESPTAEEVFSLSNPEWIALEIAAIQRVRGVEFDLPTFEECEIWRQVENRWSKIENANAFTNGYYDRNQIERSWVATARELARRAGRPEAQAGLSPKEAMTFRRGCQQPKEGLTFTNCQSFEAAKTSYWAVAASKLGIASEKKLDEWYEHLAKIEALFSKKKAEDLATLRIAGNQSVPMATNSYADVANSILQEVSASGEKETNEAFASLTPSALDYRRRQLGSAGICNPRPKKYPADLKAICSAIDGLKAFNKAKQDLAKAVAGERYLLELPGKLESAIDSGDAKGLKSLRAGLVKDGVNAVLAAFPDLKNAAEELFDKAQILVDAEIDERLARSILDLTPKEWRRRHVLFLEQQIDALDRHLAQLGLSPYATTFEDLRAKLQAWWAETVGVAEEVRRQEELLLALDEILAEELAAPAAPAPEVPGLDDYETARLELEKVRQVITAKRADLKSSTPTPPPERIFNPFVLVYRQDGPSNPTYVKKCVEDRDPAAFSECAVSGWTYGEAPARRGEHPPEFVVVIEKGATP